MSPLPAASREPRGKAVAGRFPRGSQQRLRLRQPVLRPSRWQRTVASIRRALQRFFSWGGWPKLAALATALTAVAALWFSAKSLGSTEKQYALSAQGQVTDRFTKSVEQLGSDKLDVRLGGIYSLERLARDSHADRSVIFEVLGACIRTHAGRYERHPGDASPFVQATGCTPSSVPTVDIQAAATVIGRRDRPAPPRERIDLRQVCLPNVILDGAYLDGAMLDGAYLDGAELRSASLVDATLVTAVLEGASFDNSNVTGADLRLTDLAHSVFHDANLTGVKLFAADLSDANLVGANFTGAHLGSIYYDMFTQWPRGFTPPRSRPHKDQI
jgi:hypothetical protein